MHSVDKLLVPFHAADEAALNKDAVTMINIVLPVLVSEPLSLLISSAANPKRSNALTSRVLIVSHLLLIFSTTSEEIISPGNAPILYIRLEVNGSSRPISSNKEVIHVIMP